MLYTNFEGHRPADFGEDFEVFLLPYMGMAVILVT